MATNQPPPNYGFTDQPGGPAGPGGPPMGAPMGSPGGQPEGNGMAVAGLVLGIIGLVFCWVPFLGWILALLGIIFGGLGMSRANKIGGRGKGLAIGGLVCGVLGLVIGVALFFYAMKVSRGRAMRFGEIHQPQPELRAGAELAPLYRS